MLSFKQYLSESKKPAPGILHIEHPSDRSFDSPEAAHHALKTLKGVSSGKTPITRKIDDRMSFQAIRTADGKVGVKYKGTGSHYNFSASDIEKQHGHKPYLAAPLKALHKHLGKILPKHAGEYQGGYMSEPHTRQTKDGHISHTPNTVEYHTPLHGEEGKKLQRSKVSLVIHSELKGEDKKAHPLTNMQHFGSHPDVHLVQHLVHPEERKLSKTTKASVDHHLSSAERLMKDHSYHHLAGHETSLRTYINYTVSKGEKPTVAGYKAHLGAAHDKKIEAVKMAKTKEAKTLEKNAAMAHINKNKEHFEKSFEIHHHLQQATNHLARGLDHSGGGGFHTRVGGEKAGGEGYVANGIKVVDREGFSKANAAAREKFKANK